MIERLNAIAVEVAVYMPERAKARLESLKNQEGQAFVEYALVLTLVAVAVALLSQWNAFRDAITNALGRVENAITNAGTSTGSNP